MPDEQASIIAKRVFNYRMGEDFYQGEAVAAIVAARVENISRSSPGQMHGAYVPGNKIIAFGTRQSCKRLKAQGQQGCGRIYQRNDFASEVGPEL